MQVVAVQVHDLIPRGYEVLHEDLLRVGRCINFRDGPELRVETENQVHTRGGPLYLTCPAIRPLKQAFRSRRCLLLGRHVERVELSSAWGVWMLGAFGDRAQMPLVFLQFSARRASGHRYRR